jgi:hypothetical protein
MKSCLILKSKMIRLILLSLVGTFLISCSNSNSIEINLPFEKSNGLKTATYEETIDLVNAVSEGSDIVSKCVYGHSSQGYALPMLIVDKDELDDPESIRKNGRTILLVEANIHPGEPDGNDAMMLLIKELLNGDKIELLENVSILFAPAVNADGMNRFGPYNRINQNGPVEMGWRTNAQNLNLNRDFVKADAPAMQAWLKMYNKWQPEFFIDCHTTDGADYQYVITYMLETMGNMDENLTKWQKDNYLPFVEKEMFKAGYPIFPYVSFRRWHDPRSGLYMRPGRPMLSQGYTALRNRPGLLIETHMLKPYKQRVLATKKMIELTIQNLNKEGKALQKLIFNADQYVASKPFRSADNLFAVAYKNSEQHDTVDFLGVEYDIVKSDLTGGDWFQYHTDKPTTFRLPIFRYIEPAYEVTLPEAYIIPKEWSTVIERMKLHGIKMEQIDRDREFTAETYHFTDVNWHRTPYEGRMHLADFELEKEQESMSFSKGDMYVSMAQPQARLIAWMLEPRSPDSFLQWGFFDAIFEQKEYSETYVMEGMAREMMAKDPELKKQFEKFVEDNPEVKNSSWSQLNWFYQRTPYWDKKKNVYPVRRVVEVK